MVSDVKHQYPATVDSAVRLLQDFVSAEEQEKIRLMKVDDLVELHFGLGQWVRNYFGLWGVNPALLLATGERTADDASAVLIRAFWNELQCGLTKIH